MPLHIAVCTFADRLKSLKHSSQPEIITNNLEQNFWCIVIFYYIKHMYLYLLEKLWTLFSVLISDRWRAKSQMNRNGSESLKGAMEQRSHVWRHSSTRKVFYVLNKMFVSILRPWGCCTLIVKVVHILEEQMIIKFLISFLTKQPKDIQYFRWGHLDLKLYRGVQCF